MAEIALVWLRNDLRLADNPALTAALHTGLPVEALHVDETDPGLRPLGGASRWWLHQSLARLARDLAAIGVPLRTARGPAAGTLLDVARETRAAALFWNRRYAPAQCTIDAAIKSALRENGLRVESFAANVLIEPWDIETGTGRPYSVYTPFWKALRARAIPRPLSAPAGRSPVAVSEPVDAAYRQPRWAEKLAPHWQVGEAAAAARLAAFLEAALADYQEGRDFPARDVTSRLSPHLAFGEISPRQVWHATEAAGQRHPAAAAATEKFLKELVWRDFNYHQLYHRPDIASHAMQDKFDRLAWRSDPAALAAWQRGETGFPIIDAGMRELWQTGYMQNRVRMLVGSLLAKNLLLDWRLGEAWFWDTLCDADIASNAGNWQWVAGSGLDAAPFFRIFNPVTQSEKFDAAGAYIRRWLPELARLPDALIHDPTAAPAYALRDAGVSLDTTYPRAILDLKATRARALQAFSAL